MSRLSAAKHPSASTIMSEFAPYSRRTFLLSLFGVGAAGAATLAVAPPAMRETGPLSIRLARLTGIPTPSASLANATHADWEREIGSIFTTSDGYRMRLALIEALSSPGARPPSVMRNRAFIATFDVLGGGLMPGERIHNVSHALHGRFNLFLSAPRNVAAGRRMTALLN